MKFCSSCGAPVSPRVPQGDNRQRYVCDTCETIHYQNPRIVAGCLPVWQDRVLLCQRAIAPRKGYWTLPAGFLENGETIAEGAARETHEEARARVANLELYTVFSLPHISQVYMFYRADLLDLNYGCGEESLAVELFKEQDIPWQNMAFPVITRSLQTYFEHRNEDHYPVLYEEIDLTHLKRD